MRSIIFTLINVTLGIIGFFLGARILLRLFGANPSTPFVSWVYDISSSIMAPFSGIFPSAQITEGQIFDIPAFIALVVYALVGYFVMTLVSWLFAAASRRDVGHRMHYHEG